MTVVNPKSISGINSITTGSGSDNLLTIHTSDASSTERVRINSSGDVIVGSGITVSPDGDIFATGVTTSTTFVGAVTGNVTGNISGGTVAGSTGTFTGDVDIADKIVHTGDTDTAIRFSAADTISIETGGVTRATVSGNNIDFPDGYISELNFNNAEWINSIDQCIQSGILFIVDYGYPAQEYFIQDRSDGTLVCIHQHKPNFDPLSNIGDQDISSFVNFSHLKNLSLNTGLTVSGYMSQSAFLINLNILDIYQSKDLSLIHI